MILNAFILLFQEVPADPVVVDRTTTWIGLAGVVATMVFSIVRQELAARRVTREAQATKVEVQEKVAAVTEKMDEQQRDTNVHRQQLKQEVKTAIIDAAAIGKNQYQDATQWRQYIDERMDQMTLRVNEFSNTLTSNETLLQSIDTKLDDIKQQLLDLRRR